MSPVRSQRFTLYPYQRRAVSRLEARDGLAALFMTMGTGKTPTSISFLARNNFKRILIACPLAAVGVWRNQLRELNAPWEIVTLPGGSVEKAVKRLELLRPTRKVRVVIVNLDAYWRYPAETRKKKDRKTGEVYAHRLPLRGVRKWLLDWKPDAVVIDEAHRLADRTTNQAKFAHELAQLPTVKARIPLTGSAVDEGIEDLFSIYKFMDSGIFGTNYGDFERRFVIRGGYGGYQITGYRNLHIIKRILANTSFQVGDEVLGLPERVTQILPVTLNARNRKLYDTMKKEAIIELETPAPDGRPLRGIALASIVLTTLIRLQQLANGFVPVTVDADGDTPEQTRITDVGDDKLRTTVSLVEDALAAKKQVVIFVKFIHDMERLIGSMPHHYRLSGGVGCLYCGRNASKGHLAPAKESIVGTISGNVGISGPIARRDATIAAFQKGKLKVLIVQAATGSLSIDLTAAEIAIFYSTGYSLKEFSQARGRVYRHGQTKHVVEYLLQVENSIDETIYAALARKQDVSRRVSSIKFAKAIISGPTSTPTDIEDHRRERDFVECDRCGLPRIDHNDAFWETEPKITPHKFVRGKR